jgi:hypothetical protein
MPNKVDKRTNHHRVSGPSDRLKVDREAVKDLLNALRFPVAIEPPMSVVRIVTVGDADEDE